VGSQWFDALSTVTQNKNGFIGVADVKMNVKLLSIVIFTFLLLTLPVSAITKMELEDNIIKKCEDNAIYWLNGPYIDTSEVVYCSLLQLITFKKVMRHYTEHYDIINQIVMKHWDDEYETTNWPTVLDELERYLYNRIPLIPAQ
jgi:hypothetical protein